MFKLISLKRCLPQKIMRYQLTKRMILHIINILFFLCLQKLNELKELGNNAVKEEKCEAAVLYYTQAIKMDPSNFTLYSNRSYAFLKMQQYYLAMEDAKQTIHLNPSWAKVCKSINKI